MNQARDAARENPAAVARPAVRPVVLIILDGFGEREDAPDNAISRASMPNWRRLMREAAHSTIDASERHVGLPTGQMGNSEVGHLNIGAGRVVYQDLTRIDRDIEGGAFADNPALGNAIALARDSGATLHVLGLVSPGGVHSHEGHIVALIAIAALRGVKRIAVHAFLDGRDTPPRSSAESLALVETACANAQGEGSNARIASLCGRYYAMDRDKRWERVEKAYALLVDGIAPHSAVNAQQGLKAAYARGESDEFVQPTLITGGHEQPTTINDGDVVVFMNFRADRAREITRALTDPDFDAFKRKRVPQLARFVTLTRYGDDFAHLAIAYAAQSVANGFGEYVASLGLRQLRIAETEKYAHVTYFFNGGSETPYPGEDRILVPSPKVATYDLKPEMSAIEVTDKLIAAIRSGIYDAVICNYANADMVGHTGNFEAAIKAVETLDACLGRVVEATRSVGGEVLITADHGNVEMMHDHSTGQSHTAHTRNVVPLVYIGRPAEVVPHGVLADVAPTLLAMMGVSKPPEMTGHSLIHWRDRT
ncbi:MAG TPA: 2,3-bisphosphoglycerate-independent phosphoglycerate mutase [Casimicrobiaceae bacterium]|nr:2,3-bisphosphoglycerate-independent phosphoglycerate mutase [Casimicrobiaceae bacterium]